MAVAIWAPLLTMVEAGAVNPRMAAAGSPLTERVSLQMVAMVVNILMEAEVGSRRTGMEMATVKETIMTMDTMTTAAETTMTMGITTMAITMTDIMTMIITMTTTTTMTGGMWTRSQWALRSV